MIISDSIQGTDEWLKERSGKVTASCFHKVFTATGAKTTGETRKNYLYQLAAERISGEPEESYSNGWMQRGNDLEADARMQFETIHGEFIAQVGMIYLDERKLISCSPDGLVGKNSGLELKCPKPSTHVGYLDAAKLPPAYKQQVMGSLWITGRETWNFMSYHPVIRPLVLIVERDEKYISSLADAIEEFNSEVNALVAKIENYQALVESKKEVAA